MRRYGAAPGGTIAAMSGAERSGAARAAETEVALWTSVTEWRPPGWEDTEAAEAAVVGFFDPADDLAKRATSWGHRLPDATLPSLTAFGAGLAAAETAAWERDEPHIATRAYTDRRFLLGDRLLHWAVPWLDAVGRCYPQHRANAHRRRDTLLRLGDRLRAVPDLGAGEGLTPPGEDAFGPIEVDVPLSEWLRSLWSGAVILDQTVRSLGAEGGELAASDSARRDLATLFEVTAQRWLSLAATHEGSARLWRDLAARAARTAAIVGP